MLGRITHAQVRTCHTGYQVQWLSGLWNSILCAGSSTCGGETVAVAVIYADDLHPCIEACQWLYVCSAATQYVMWLRIPCRPSFKELTPQLQVLLDLIKEEEVRKSSSSSSKGGLLSKLNLRSKEGSSKDSRG